MLHRTTGGARRADTVFDRFLDRVSSRVDVSAAGNDFSFDAVNVAWGDQVAAGVGAVDLVSIPWPMILIAPVSALVAMLAGASIIGQRAARPEPTTVLRRVTRVER